ncbi:MULTISPECIES: SIS domain-containing protein [unclassified Rhizobium]|uniref:SIS domain-containing protein n=1 Tax=unclassified Rhizobium TaxID=2613769 RepID=UPI001AD9705F|nr:MULTISPECIES: SIS domain-containing protein [unclassified Rhizobium]MBO9100236.1 SIS domain-containing protein [Rhizobium sp. L58/93]MBO9135607.1 SIS domain-containing protein [Rhizobium sp. B209b/85]MBO9170202.1 SIS domain-containing protein [Rhizobium sp. L245/93]MBO9186129.1 SIS domain-containing protein [Rhizobium sp. E27B/91]QXZ83055.1 SIS domain-containing protein [Rhizobium sp. K1/93]
MTAITDAYFLEVIERLGALRQSLAEPMARAAAVICEAARSDHRVYLFGTGHSHMLAEEVHYRAGGLAITVPVLVGSAMLYEGAVISSIYERTPGLVRPVLERYRMERGDVLVIASNSGVNAAPTEAADYGREIGTTVIAITSLAYSAAIANGRRRLADIADIVFDNGLPPGDALVDLPGTDLKVGPASTAIGATLLNAIFAEVASQLSVDGDPPVYRSANMPGAKDINQRLVDIYRPRNPHL